MTVRDWPGLSDRTILVTGAAAGIGRGVAEAVGKAGAKVVIADIDADGMTQLASELSTSGASVLAIQADMTDSAQVERMVNRAVEEFGGLDGLVLAAGGFPQRKLVEEITPDDWDRGITQNLSSAFYCCRAAVPHMKNQGGGTIVVVASAAGRTVNRQQTAYYGAAKTGLLGLTRHLAFELGEHGIRVNAVAPGVTLTPRIERLYDESRLEAIRQTVPLGRVAEVDDQVGPVLFLLSAQSGYMTGATLDVSGGRVLV